MSKKGNRAHRAYWHRVLLKSMGYCDKEINATRIAVVNSWSEQSPGHIHLRDLGDAVKAGIRLAGAMPFEMNVLGPCTGMGDDQSDALHYDLPQREVILSSIETGIKVGGCDGWVGLCTCDKIVPAMILAAIRLNKPCIIVTGGPMLPGKYQGDWVAMGKGSKIVSPKLHAGTLTDEELEEVTCAAGYACGACAEMTTGNSMQIMAEALGLTLPGTSTIPAVAARIKVMAKEAGMQIVNLAENETKPSQIVGSLDEERHLGSDGNSGGNQLHRSSPGPCLGGKTGYHPGYME